MAENTVRASASSNPTRSPDVLNSTKTRAPAYYMGARIPPSQPKTKTPGPGAYSIDQGLATGTKGWSMHGGKRRLDDHLTRKEIPGPGHYDLITHKSMAQGGASNGWSFGGGRYTLPSSANRNPGPGNYNLSSHKEIGKDGSPAYTVRPRPELKKHSGWEVPGPGTYTPTPANLPRTAPSHTMAARRNPLSQSESPGPGAYRTEDVAPQGQNRSPSYSMGLKTKLPQRDATPSPSDYISV